MDTYTEAHIFVAAIRVLQHQKNIPPTLEDVCELLGSSAEAGYAICRTLKKRGIIETLEDPYSIKLFVADHLALEQIPKTREQENTLAKELEKFQQEKRSKDKDVAKIQAELDRKKQEKLSDIEKKFKEQMKKYTQE